MSSTRSPGLLLAFILCGRDSYKLSWRGVAWRATLLDCCYQRLSCTIGIGVWPKLKGDQEEKENEEKHNITFRSLHLQPYFSRHDSQSDN